MLQSKQEVLLINKAGKIILSRNLDALQLSIYDGAGFSEGLIDAYDPVAKRFGFVNKSGVFVIKPAYIQVGRFSDGLARVAIAVDGEQKIGFIDHSGQFVIPPKFNTDGDFRNSTDFSEALAGLTENLRPTITEAEKFAYIDKSGAVVLFTTFFSAGPFREGLAVVYDAKKDKWGFIDKLGRVVIPLQYDLATEFSEGLAVVSILEP